MSAARSSLGLLALSVVGFACAAFACADTGEAWSYRVPEVVDEAGLLARLRPAHEGELVLANYWASW